MFYGLVLVLVALVSFGACLRSLFCLRCCLGFCGFTIYLLSGLLLFSGFRLITLC